jgi:hypothetical protein
LRNANQVFGAIYIRISGACLLISALLVTIAGYAGRGGGLLAPNTVAMLALLALAVSSLGALELKIHRRTRFEQQRKASVLASALRKGALR